MMKLILILSVGGLLCILSLLHIYWVVGGQWGLHGAIPEKYLERYLQSENHLLMRLSTLVVAIGLMMFSFVILSNHYALSTLISGTMIRVGTLMIAIIFTLRAIGDFNIVGIFKKASDSVFAKNDNKIYIPICLFLAVGSYFIYFLS